MLVGSRAAKHHFPDFPREPKDWDYKAKNQVSGQGTDVFWHDSFPDDWDGLHVASPSFLYTCKVSHAFWNFNKSWEKHMADVLFFQRKGVEFDRPTYDILFPVWKERWGKKRVNLNKSKDDFFGDAVVRKYDHDSLHDSVAYGERPMYVGLLKEGSEVLIDNDKFWALPQEEKFKVIREEVYATALERWVIPSDYKVSPRAAYAWAIKKSITSLFKGEWALFIVLNYATLYKPDMAYVDHHLSNSDRLILL